MTLRKKYQRKLNHIVKDLNKNISEDNLWQGRFEMFQKYASFEEFPDKSGGIMFVIMRVADKATGYYKDYTADFAPYLHCEWKIWEMMNNFIVKDAKIWEEEISPRNPEFVKNYKNTPIPKETKNAPYNFYCDKESFIFK